MELILIAVLVVVVIAFIAYPLLKGEAHPTTVTPDALDSVIAQRDSAYDAIRDLDFDYQMGKLSKADYEQLRDRYKARAAQALQEIDAAAGTAGAGERIEDEVARLRQRRAAAPAESGVGGAATDAAAPPDDVLASQEERLRQWRVTRRAARHGEGTLVASAQAGESVEDQVARLRTSKRKGVSLVESAPAGSGENLQCANCGTPYQAGDRFCVKCGAKL